MRQIIFATGNEGKMREIRKILANLVVEGEETQILSMKEAGMTPDIVEDGKRFVERSENSSLRGCILGLFLPYGMKGLSHIT